MSPQELVDALGQCLGLQGWVLDAQGACALCLPDGLRMELRFVEGRSGFCLTASLGELTYVDRSEVVAGLLLANRALSEQGESWFALDRASDSIHLCRTLSYAQQDPASVCADLEQLATAAREFRRLLLAQRQVFL